MRCFFYLSLVLLIGFSNFGCTEKSTTETESANPFYPTSKPGTRWWWFASEIKKEDVRHQMDWLKQNNFGAVEIAWVYPLHRYERMYRRMYNRHYPKDTTAQKWLSPEWSSIVEFTKSYADSIGLACDFTFGSAWPVAASNLDKKHIAKIYGNDKFHQTLTFAWSWPDTLSVIDHLQEEAFQTFAEPIADALKGALKGSRSALFTDSWEIKLNATNKIWTDGFGESFEKEFGYDIIPFMEQGLDSFPDVRYDYMLHLEQYVIEGFYKPFARKCEELGAWSRVQCLASPTDVMTTYALVDIPETESMLNNPNYSRIVSSAAALASKPLVSSESFTCMYGFPHTYLRKEQTADVKMVADAMFAQGVNMHFYHGMPYNPIGSDSIEFFATTYVGPNGSLTPDLHELNSYLEKVSGIMQQGKTYADVAVYLPYEDHVMKGALPKERQRKWVWGEYELRYLYPPEELAGYHPIWINRTFLDEAVFEGGKLKVGDAEFSSLYIDANYIDIRAFRQILKLAKQGLPICLKSSPTQPGHIRSDKAYTKLFRDLEALENVTSDFQKVMESPPLVQGDSIPDNWCRVAADGTHYIFLAQRPAKGLEYPVYSGQSFEDESYFRELTFHVNGKTTTKKLEFKPYQSIMLEFTPSGEMKQVDISFVPRDPIIRERKKQKMYF